MAKLSHLQRARAAHAHVNEMLGHQKAGEYRQQLQDLPARVLSCGLGQTMAFLSAKADSKGTEPYHTVGRQLAAHLLARPSATGIDLLEHLEKMDSAEYRLMTRRALGYAEWLKRYAAALIERPNTK